MVKVTPERLAHSLIIGFVRTILDDNAKVQEWDFYCHNDKIKPEWAHDKYYDENPVDAIYGCMIYDSKELINLAISWGKVYNIKQEDVANICYTVSETLFGIGNGSLSLLNPYSPEELDQI